MKGKAIFWVHVEVCLYTHDTLCMHACGLCTGDSMFPLKVEPSCWWDDYETLVCFYWRLRTH